MLECLLEEYKTLSCVCGYHEYQRVWTAAVGEELCCKRETRQNPRDPYAVVVKKDGISQLAIYHKDVFIIFNERWKIFMCLIFTVWVNHETFLPSKLLQTMVHHFVQCEV